MQKLTTNLADVKSQIHEHVKHSYLFKYINEPVIDEDKLLLFTSIFSLYDLPKMQAEQYAVTAMLVQIALDTHELVENGELNAELHKSRQLTILAGTYYSGLYYKILSSIEDVGMIRTLAEGIKEVNEHKISVYRKDSKSIKTLMDSVKKIESALFERVLTYFNSENLQCFTANILFYKKLLMERDRFFKEKPSIVFEALGELVFPEADLQNSSLDYRDELISVADSYIENTRQEIEKLYKQIPYMNSSLQQKIQAMIDYDTHKVKSFAEEG
ncbi:heptaprenyl diphosphate synthase component 1 [Cytobacillus gottheilii]|uniref:heptaprenyl diphosphate synthase component 1 n=1 Tax=Cytobacillus gottheilii TaxID=859144 RepID=UPI0024945E5A|nr:heptaprenyl diphosphate synthase component 1 [Cytobacillus gottheilii]